MTPRGSALNCLCTTASIFLWRLLKLGWCSSFELLPDPREKWQKRAQWQYCCFLSLLFFCCAACLTAGCIYFWLQACTGLGCLYTCSFRARLRNKYGLEQKPCDDCCTDWCCLPCSLSQQIRELQNRGIDPSLGTYNKQLSSLAVHSSSSWQF
jgi:Cys-rich protein (TIGR01571 family)